MNQVSILEELATVATGVVYAVTPLVVLFLICQVLWLKLPGDKIRDMLVGTLVAALGLFVFLVGVGIGFLPFGRVIGEALGSLSPKWLMIPIAAVLGLVTTWGEPAVRILADQVEDASSRFIRRTVVVGAICVGVAVAAALGLVRIGYGVPLLYFLVPGYGLVLAIIWWCDRDFLGIAIDSGGVATGPVANTLLLALALGAAAAMGSGDLVRDGLGMVALIALAPILSVMILGLLVRRKRGDD